MPFPARREPDANGLQLQSLASVKQKTPGTFAKSGGVGSPGISNFFQYGYVACYAPTTWQWRIMQRTITIAIASLLLSFLGCNEQPPEQHGDTKSGLGKAETKGTWLDLQNDTEPAIWLLTREKSQRPSTDLPMVRRTLATASGRFGESPRMIANRAVQLEKMLQPLGEHETAISLVVELTSTVGPSNTMPGFGTYGQYYYNLRKSGFTGPQALKDLSKRYGNNK
jgi:hypothetical protein